MFFDLVTNEVFQFLQIAFSCTVLQGYGLTETCAAGCMTLRDNIHPGHGKKKKQTDNNHQKLFSSFD